MKKIAILGSTGSIGTQTLDVIREFPEKFKCIAITTNNNISLLNKQILEFKPNFAGISKNTDISTLTTSIKEKKLKTTLIIGNKEINQMIENSEIDLLIVAIAGTAAILPCYKAIKKGIQIGLATKEVLVSAGELFKPFIEKEPDIILPIDSEHAAIKQCLHGEKKNDINKITLTASGGPFWNRPSKTFNTITLKEALNHPNWTMGKKITIDSATLMNKGLEIIEAHYLFNITLNKINMIIHPQSIIHSLVEFKDGNIMAHLGPADMRFPIQYVLTYPKKHSNPWPKLNLNDINKLEFHKPSFSKFPLPKLAIETCKKKGTYPAVLNAANEAYVQLFLEKKIIFSEIFSYVMNTIESFNHYYNPTIENIISIDSEIKTRILNKTSL